MAQFDVYARRGGAVFLLDCQANLLARLNTRFVVPLLPRGSVPSIVAQLNPIFSIEGENVVLMPQNAATIMTRDLGKAMMSFDEHRYAIMNALDMLLTGY